MTAQTVKRGRGRPPQSDGADTQTRLLDAAAGACADHGFDGATLNEIARRAGVSATAVYNHFESREALLYAAAVRGLQRMTDAAAGAAATASMADIALAYLRPDMAETRRVLAEIHLAARRDPTLASMLHRWHSDVAAVMAPRLAAADDDPVATVKALFLMLLGLCHLDDLDAVDADADAVSARVVAMVDTLRRRKPTRR